MKRPTDYDSYRRRFSPLPWGFVAVTKPALRNAKVHIVQADTFGAVAKLVMGKKPLKTLCGFGTVTTEWALVPRRPDEGYLLSCNNCRGALTHFGFTAPRSSTAD